MDKTGFMAGAEEIGIDEIDTVGGFIDTDGGL